MYWSQVRILPGPPELDYFVKYKMNNNLDFFKWFETIATKLGNREISFRKIFKYLDAQPTPIIIVETGCLRNLDNFGDGQSTLLFDKYTQSRGKGSKVYTVDIDPKATKVCKETVSDKVEIVTDSSVRYLTYLSKNFIKTKTKVSMFYLDSFDVDWRYPHPAAAHHLKEFTAINRLLHEDTLVVVDDAPAYANLTQNDKEPASTWKILSSPSPTVGGKGSLIHEYAMLSGAKLIFSHYQTAWNNFNKE